MIENDISENLIANEESKISKIIATPEQELEYESHKISLEQFEGPLDLLLHMVKVQKLSIEDIFISKITEQYLEYMDQIGTLDLDRATDFLEVAATLLEIKSKSLLPKPIIEEDENNDPKKILIQRLEEYKLYKEACAKIKEKEALGIHYREPDSSVGEPQFVLKDMNMDGLMVALKKLFLKLEKKSIVNKQRKIALDRFTVAEKIAHIKDAMMFREKASFFDLFDEDYTKSEIITTFQALLELLKLQFVKAEQTEVFGDIVIHRVDAA